MKHCKFLAALLAAFALLGFGGASFAAPKVAPKKPLKVAVLLYDGVNLLDASGPLEVFEMANGIAPRTYDLFTVAERKAPVAVQGGALQMQPKYALAKSPVPDILIVPGGSMAALNAVENNATLMRWISQRAANSRLTMSVCTGAFLLGKTGALDGKRATTHWFTTEMFQRQFPKIKAMEGVRYIQDGKFITTAGVSSGLDGTLFLVEKTAGKQVAETTARAIQYRRNTAPFPAVPMRAVKIAPRRASAAGGKTESDFDLVCGMNVGETPRFTAKYQGKTYGFCSAHCRDQFVAHPANFVKKSGAAPAMKMKMPSKTAR